MSYLLLQSKTSKKTREDDQLGREILEMKEKIKEIAILFPNKEATSSLVDDLLGISL
ncbi:MAG: hypothetical protein HQ539_00980 [Parcubacteria group bacterium]|nr:hypothetical protein [Parcubacteria group bacterium]